MIKLVLDTNILVASLSSRSAYHWLIRLILDEKVRLFITDEILLEYEEVLKIKYSDVVATTFLAALNELPNIYSAKVYFRWNLISDGDDNKFVDCYVSAGADILVTQDTHFNVLKSISFPKVITMTLSQFESYWREFGE